MHRLFVSRGIIIGKRGVGESNTRVAIFTRELGLLKAAARSARRENSKLRYGLEPLSLGTFSFIRGKHEWKLTGAQDVSHEFISGDVRKRQSVGRITRLLLRLIHGEEPNFDLYNTLEEGLKALVTATPENIESIETVLVLRVLSHLGYLPNTPQLRPFIERDFFSMELQQEIAASRALLIRAINDSLGASGL
ncbi:MAG TPA: DNA repair protein RecO [Candidatus Paceibacterota bacterium]|nr:DNA repair protein RecO [Candidatus Paceibacterota bacterium]